MCSSIVIHELLSLTTINCFIQELTIVLFNILLVIITLFLLNYLLSSDFFFR